MKKTVLLLIAFAMLSASYQSFGQTDTTRVETISHSHYHSQSGQDYSYEYSYEYSYDVPKYPVKGGVKLNGNLSGFVITDNPNLQSTVKFGLSFGGFMKVEFSKHFAL